MAVIGLKKTLNFHRYKLKLDDILSNWKIVIPTVFSIIGLILGCAAGKGEGGVYLKITEYIRLFLDSGEASFTVVFFRYLFIPTALDVILFFLGLSLFGGAASNAVIFVFTYMIGTISYYMYNEYTLKGLAFCVILIYPYAVAALLGMILSCRETINMSELILKKISKSGKLTDYSFSDYYKSFLKYYIIIPISAALSALLEGLFGSIFVF